MTKVFSTSANGFAGRGIDTFSDCSRWPTGDSLCEDEVEVCASRGSSVRDKFVIGASLTCVALVGGGALALSPEEEVIPEDNKS